MGRKKIQIHKIDDAKNREVTFNKRKVGLMKKAIELSVLCDCEVAVIVFHGSHLYQYSSDPFINRLLDRYSDYQGPYEQIVNEDLDDLKPGKASSFKVGRTYMKQRTQPSAAMATVIVAQDQLIETQSGGPAPPASSSPEQVAQSNNSACLLTKRGRKRTLNVHIPLSHNASVVELLPPRPSNSSATQTASVAAAPPAPTGRLAVPSGQLYSPRYLRMPSGPGTWTQAAGVPCMSPQYLPYSTHSMANPSGPGALNSSLNTPTLSPFASYPSYSHGPPSPALPLPTYPVAQL